MLFRSKRKASFFSVIAIITEEDEVLTAKGECKGYIGFEASGFNDFGYDPLFIPEGYEKTFAELSSDIKNNISHRSRALEEIKETMKNLLEDE